MKERKRMCDSVYRKETYDEKNGGTFNMGRKLMFVSVFVNKRSKICRREKKQPEHKLIKLKKVKEK